jgi:hypothetical protein
LIALERVGREFGKVGDSLSEFGLIGIPIKDHEKAPPERDEVQVYPPASKSGNHNFGENAKDLRHADGLDDLVMRADESEA